MTFNGAQYIVIYLIVNFRLASFIQTKINQIIHSIMLKLLSKTICRKFCIAPEVEKTFQLLYQIKDLTVLKGQAKNEPYIKIDGEKIDLFKYKLLFELNEDLETKKGRIEFYDKHMNLYHPTTPTRVMCMESFYIRMADTDNLFFVMNNSPIIKLSQSQQFAPTYCSPILEDICRESINELPDNPNEVINGANIHNLMVANLLKHGMNYKLEKIRLKQLKKVVERELLALENEVTEIMKKVQVRANKRLKIFTNLLISQYAIIHYFIYFHLSWDIMEPITVIFANFDIFVAYYFFIMKGRDWSLESMHQSYVEQRKWKFLQKNGVDVQKYRQLLSIKQNIEFRLALLTKNPYQLVKALSKPIKLLDTR